MSITTWPEIFEDVRRRLGSGQEARWLIEEVAGDAHPTTAPSERARSRLHELVDRRAHGEPLQYVLGRWSFRTLDLMVDRRVLIPRPETEQVVEAALAELDRLGPGPKQVVDLGTGSGAIALSLAAERPKVEVWATDVDPGALDVARANLSGMGGFAATRVALALGDWWSALPPDLRGSIDLVVSNPPYVASGEMATLEPTVLHWEPRRALEAGPVGTEALAHILSLAPAWLRAGGVAVLEIAPDQAGAASDLARRRGFAHAEIRKDLAGRDRVLVARTS